MTQVFKHPPTPARFELLLLKPNPVGYNRHSPPLFVAAATWNTTLVTGTPPPPPRGRRGPPGPGRTRPPGPPRPRGPAAAAAASGARWRTPAAAAAGSAAKAPPGGTARDRPDTNKTGGLIIQLSREDTHEENGDEKRMQEGKSNRAFCRPVNAQECFLPLSEEEEEWVFPLLQCFKSEVPPRTLTPH